MTLDLSNDYQRQLCLGLYEPEIAKELFTLLRSEVLFIDVGANIGYYTLLASKLVGLYGHVLSFEADPANANELRKNVLFNSCSNVTLFPKAVSDQAGKKKLVTGEHSVGSSLETADNAVQRLGPTYVGSTKKVIEVDAVTLDEKCLSVDIERFCLRVLKIDIEGAEPLALRGGQRLLRVLDAVIVEINDFMLKVHGFSPRDVLMAIWEADFQVYPMIERRSMKALQTSAPIKNGNYLCLKSVRKHDSRACGYPL